MSERPYVTLSCAMSIDGYLDSAEPARLAMSNAADLDRVDAVRAHHDAIMVGASTVRRDNPRLLVRDAARRARRLATGRYESPAKVTVTASGELSPDAAFFTTGDGPRIVYCPRERATAVRDRLGDRATVVGLGEDCVTMAALVEHLGAQEGVRSLMVEGGGTVLTQFLSADLVDELHLVVAPFFVGEARAPRVVGPAAYPWTAGRRAHLADTRQIGDVVLLRYALSERFGMLDARESATGAEALAAQAADAEAVTAELP
ncbi:dihydrofolate reductase family protein [Microbacterium sp. M3]|uniref:Dihydrofolate reductase family protein n=1 Tax=Microbacterium arthrosphaerae TaxID=792652 RepID=A0ABU4GXC9_9MICO|nr:MULTISPECIES: dihydrofolate reductase family protein [Microbacterium]MDW4571723.1 dihydrofolate reductase family protein [Microbacterium arthrosphaerae]MDW7605578.1 dihydrofolate reductase family protein [Microbacterium sp. M3]